MSFVIALLTFILFLTCLFLCLLILVQLPKKEAGMGTAFGGDAAVAVFGAGTGNALTRMTKYATGTFLVLCVLLTAMNAYRNRSRSTAIERELSKTPIAAPAAGASAAPFSSLMAPTVSNAPAGKSMTNVMTNVATPSSILVSNVVKSVAPTTNPLAPRK